MQVCPLQVSNGEGKRTTSMRLKEALESELVKLQNQLAKLQNEPASLKKALESHLSELQDKSLRMVLQSVIDHLSKR